MPFHQLDWENIVNIYKIPGYLKHEKSVLPSLFPPLPEVYEVYRCFIPSFVGKLCEFSKYKTHICRWNSIYDKIYSNKCSLNMQEFSLQQEWYWIVCIRLHTYNAILQSYQWRVSYGCFTIGTLCIIIFLSERSELGISICSLITLKIAYAHALLFAFACKEGLEKISPASNNGYSWRGIKTAVSRDRRFSFFILNT